MAERDRLIETFLDQAGWPGAERRPLAGDASYRRYDRITREGATAVLMDAPPVHEDVRPFIHMTRHLQGLGYSAPQLLGEDIDNGFLLLEDLGDDTYTRALASGVDEAELYTRATDLLIDLHRRESNLALPTGLADYDVQKLVDEALLLTDWHMPQVTGRDTATDARAAFVDIWQSLIPSTDLQAPTLVMRDFHADNLIWLPARNGIRACGLLDYQDAVIGSPAYDLMSLLEDARRDLRPELADHLKDRYRAAFPDLDRSAFETAFQVLAAQRHCKVIGIFTRLAVRDKKVDYLTHIPRVWRMLERAVETPGLAALKAWLDRHIPAGHRSAPLQKVDV